MFHSSIFCMKKFLTDQIKVTISIVSPKYASEARLTHYETVKCEYEYTRYERYMTLSDRSANEKIHTYKFTISITTIR